MPDETSTTDAQAAAAVTPAQAATTEPQAGKDTPASTDLAKELADARKEAANYRTRLRELERAEDERKKAAMTEQERVAAERDEARTTADRLAAELRQERTVAAIKETAASIGYDAKLAAALSAGHQFEYDDSGKPKGVAQFLRDLAKEYPQLTIAQTGSGATNPARGGASPFDLARLRVSDSRLWQT